MDPSGIQGDALAEVATFLARRWSGRADAAVEVTGGAAPGTRLAEGRITLAPLGKRIGDGFARYRQLRMSLWYESMRLRHCTKVLSTDHAFGFILNAMESRRVEAVGRREWAGMDAEIMFNDAYALASRPQLGSVYGRARLVEAFYQQFMFGTLRGALQPSDADRAARAAGLAREAVGGAVAGGHGTEWLEGRVGGIVAELGIDSLLTIPVSVPFVRGGMALDERELRRVLGMISKSRGAELGRADADAAARGEGVRGEYAVLLEEGGRSENRGVGPEAVGIRVPEGGRGDGSGIYDAALVHGLKTRFRDWRTGWSERHAASGDEFDAEGHIEGHGPFITDVKRSIKTSMAILLDHSSSIASDSLGYKKATLALCEVLAFLRVRFAVYAFSTSGREVVCWSIKPHGQRWGAPCARRLAGVAANGSTPLADVYDKVFPVLQARRPDLFLTLTDGEPSDPDAVRRMTRAIHGLGIGTAALGLGPTTVRATAIAGNLGRLGYGRTVAVSRLADIPARVMGMLERQ